MSNTESRVSERPSQTDLINRRNNIELAMDREHELLAAAQANVASIQSRLTALQDQLVLAVGRTL